MFANSWPVCTSGVSLSARATGTISLGQMLWGWGRVLLPSCAEVRDGPRDHQWQDFSHFSLRGAQAARALHSCPVGGSSLWLSGVTDSCG